MRNHFLRAAGKGLWAPARIATALWLDAADASTVTVSSDLISQVNDKSGNARNFTASGSARPTYTSGGLGGLPVFTFGGLQFLTSASAVSTWNFLHNNTQNTVWIVAKAGNTSDPQAQYYLYGTATGSSNVGAGFLYADVDYGGGKNNNIASDYVVRGVSGASAVDNTSQNNAIIANTPFLASVAHDLSNATPANRSLIQINGGLPIANNAVSRMASTADASFALQVGAGGGNQFPLVGYICEMVITLSLATTSDKQLMEGYLAHKWGLAANLPSGHPYKSVAPT